jgi:hypothetical protein
MVTVTVYPRLAALLHDRHLTVADLARQIAERFGLTVDLRTLQRLTQDVPMHRADLEIAGAVAAVLGVDLGDLFAVEATPLDAVGEAQYQDLDLQESRRLSLLLARQQEDSLTEAEVTELASLMAMYARRLHDRRMRHWAARRGISIEQANQEAEARLTDALAWWEALQADPQRQQDLVERAARQHAASS